MYDNFRSGFGSGPVTLPCGQDVYSPMRSCYSTCPNRGACLSILAEHSGASISIGGVENIPSPDYGPSIGFREIGGAEDYAPSLGGAEPLPDPDAPGFPRYNTLPGGEPPVMMEENHHEEGNGMSFVGMLLKKDKIIAFGDSKPTIITALGTQAEDMERGRINKVFANKDFVLATSGANQFFIQKDYDVEKINIEDWLRANMGKYHNYMDLINALSDSMARNSSTLENAIWFIAGSAQRGECFVQSFRVWSEGILIERKQTTPDLYTQGYGYYNNRKAEIVSEAREAGADIGEDVFRSIIEGYIKHADDIGGYNPAGLPVNVITWRPM